MFHDTFKSLSHVQPDVLYPIPDFSAFNKPVDPPSPDLVPSDAQTIFLSINRYERKKNLGLAVKALGKFFTVLTGRFCCIVRPFRPVAAQVSALKRIPDVMQCGRILLLRCTTFLMTS